MQSLFEAIEKYKIGEPKHGDPITDMIQKFQIEINKEAGVKYKVGEQWKKTREYSFGEVRSKLILLNEQQLRAFYSDCIDYKRRHRSFRKCFFGALKIK
jgi:hypothetical protein